MARDNNRSTTKSNFEIGESSWPPAPPTDELVREALPTRSIDGPSKEMISCSLKAAPPGMSTSIEISHAFENRLGIQPSKQITTSKRHVDEMPTFLCGPRLIAGEECWPIPKVPHRLRAVKAIAYEPNAISIGPYHYGNEHLRAMDYVKRSSFYHIVKKTDLQFIDFVESMKPLKERALKCYGGPMHHELEYSDDKFIKMMVYDGCFIVQLIRDMGPPELDELPGHIFTDMWHDLLLLENQLPFFVLLELDRMITKYMPGPLVMFKDAALLSFSELDSVTLQIFSGSGTCPSPTNDIKHLLDLVHKCCRPSLKEINQPRKYSETKKAEGSIYSLKFIRSASELDNAGINFAGEKGKNLFDVTFTKDANYFKLKIHNKVLKIPTLYVCESTERRLRNLMAYEQFTPKGEPTYVSDYVMLMDNLINTGKDVQLLSTSGVIDNWLGDDEVVAQMFNKLRDSTYAKGDFYYAEIFGKVNEHCKGRWNKSKAKLMKDYFNSPWSFISFSAAFVLLMATLLQTVYALLSYYKPDDGGTHPPPPPPS